MPSVTWKITQWDSSFIRLDGQSFHQFKRDGLYLFNHLLNLKTTAQKSHEWHEARFTVSVQKNRVFVKLVQEYFPPTLNSLSVALCHLSPTSIILPHPRLSTCPYQKGGTLLVNLRFSPGSSVAGGASIIQLGWTIAARLAPQLPCSRQIRQRTKLFMMEEWKDGNRWNHRAPVSHLTNERVIFTNECWLFRSGVSTFLKSNLEMYYNNCQN